MMLNKRERNRLYQVIEQEKFDPAEFDLIDSGGKATVTHNSGSVFEFTNATSESDAWVVLSGMQYEYKFSVTEGNSDAGKISTIAHGTQIYVPTWLKEIRLTVGVPDYWDEMKHRSRLLTEVQAGSDNAPFTLGEQKQIAAQLQEVKNQIREQFELTSEQIAKLDERLDEAAEASERMGRKDWLLLFAGTILSLILTDILTPSVAEHIFTAVLTGLAHLFTDSGGPPEIPPHLLT